MATDSGRWAPGLVGTTAIVTGAGRLRSVGRQVSLELARQGANIVLTGTGRSPDTYPDDERAIDWRDIDSVADEIRALGVEALPLVADVTDPQAGTRIVAAAGDRFGGVDILINNAGAARGEDRQPLLDLPLEAWERVLRVNLTGAFLIAQAAGRQMVAQGRGGSIVNISSVSARLAPANAAVYSASKAGLNAMSHSLAMELAKHRIRVNAVLPGILDTHRTDDIGRAEAWQHFVRSRVPLGNPGDGAETAVLCAFLCSDLGAWITGQDIAVDGGMTWR